MPPFAHKSRDTLTACTPQSPTTGQTDSVHTTKPDTGQTDSVHTTKPDTGQTDSTHTTKPDTGQTDSPQSPTQVRRQPTTN